MSAHDVGTIALIAKRLVSIRRGLQHTLMNAP